MTGNASLWLSRVIFLASTPFRNVLSRHHSDKCISDWVSQEVSEWQIEVKWQWGRSRSQAACSIAFSLWFDCITLQSTHSISNSKRQHSLLGYAIELGMHRYHFFKERVEYKYFLFSAHRCRDRGLQKAITHYRMTFLCIYYFSRLLSKFHRSKNTSLTKFSHTYMYSWYWHMLYKYEYSNLLLVSIPRSGHWCSLRCTYTQLTEKQRDVTTPLLETWSDAQQRHHVGQAAIALSDRKWLVWRSSSAKKASVILDYNPRCLSFN